MARANSRLNVLRAISRAGVDKNILMRLFKTYVQPLMEYGSASFIAAPKTSLSKLQKTQNEAIRICLRLPRYIRVDLLHEYASLNPIKERLVNVNRRLLETMIIHNDDIRDLVQQRNSTQDSLPKSPLDILVPE